MPISGIDLLGVMYRKFPLAHGNICRELGIIEHVNLLYAQTVAANLTETIVLKSMSCLHVILFYNFVTL